VIQRKSLREIDPMKVLWTEFVFVVGICVLNLTEPLIHRDFNADNHPRSNERVSKSFPTGRLERELQMVQLSATGCSCIAILWDSLVSFATITLCVASQRVFIVVVVVFYFVMTQSGNFWIHPRTVYNSLACTFHARCVNLWLMPIVRWFVWQF
jgi:hypothetical protein